ncbi:hypothetical protein EVAR_55385_1 [Eumeta japonica]|uniref:Uncharacterized protein n=1 Tax=Eumeta variegata TaxID=151549 RepID=A0A4C1YMQ6_EUMVA|nr:hypothetical protein EVAR_55385_1 [Eumeta japonica]
MQHATHCRPSDLFFHYESLSSELNIDSRELTYLTPKQVLVMKRMSLPSETCYLRLKKIRVTLKSRLEKFHFRKKRSLTAVLNSERATCHTESSKVLPIQFPHCGSECRRIKNPPLAPTLPPSPRAATTPRPLHLTAGPLPPGEKRGRNKIRLIALFSRLRADVTSSCFTWLRVRLQARPRQIRPVCYRKASATRLFFLVSEGSFERPVFHDECAGADCPRMRFEFPNYKPARIRCAYIDTWAANKNRIDSLFDF